MTRTAIGNLCLALVLLISVGAKANATAIKIGQNASATVDDSIAIGVSSVSNSRYATALGSTTQSLGFGSTSVGYRTYSSAPGATAVGYGSRSTGYYSSAVGFRATATGKNSAVLGYSSEARGSGNLVLGENLVADGVGSMILGRSEEGSPIINSVPNSFSINFFSKTPTFFVAGGSSGVAGKVGIGTNAPQAALDVIGDIKSDSLKTKSLSADLISTKNLKSEIGEFSNVLSDVVISKAIVAKEEFISSSVKAEEVGSKVIDSTSIKATDVISDINISTDSITKHLEVSDAVSSEAYATILHAHLATSVNDFSSNSLDKEALKEKYLLELEYKKSIAEENLKKYTILFQEAKTPEQGVHYSSLANEFESKVLTINEQIKQLINEDRIIEARVGIGTDSPRQLLHINGAMRLEPRDNAPLNASMGDLYMDKSGALCVFIDSWEVLTGKGYCNESAYKPEKTQDSSNPYNEIGSSLANPRPHIPSEIPSNAK